jgi:hypothetical protein
VALMVNVTVAVYVPVAYTGSSVSDHATDPEFPALVDCALAPNVATPVLALVLAVCEPVHAVPGFETVHEYVRASPVLGGVVTDGPLAGPKSAVTLDVMEPVPPAFVVRIWYVKAVVPVNGTVKFVPAVVKLVVPVVTVRAASGPTATESVVVCASAKPVKASNAQAIIVSRFMVSPYVALIVNVIVAE